MSECNRIADEVATERAVGSVAVRRILPPKEWSLGPVFSIGGEMVMVPDESLDLLYSEEIMHRAAAGLTLWDARWSGYD